MRERKGITRRKFLAASGGIAAGAGALTGCARMGRMIGTRRNLVTVRDSHWREVGEKDPWSALRAIGADGFEVDLRADLTCSSLLVGEKAHSIATEDEAKRLSDEARANGLRITAFCMHNRFEERADEEVNAVATAARACGKIGIGVIRLDVLPRRLKDDEFLKFAIGICKQVVEKTADTAVRFGIENHGGTTNQIAFLERLFDGVGSDRMGLTLDTGNFYWFGYPLNDLYRIYGKFASRVFHTHCKSIAYPKAQQNEQRQIGWEYGKYTCPIYEGDIDFRRVVAILREADYGGDFCIENESLGKFPKEKRREVLAKEVAFLRKLL